MYRTLKTIGCHLYPQWHQGRSPRPVEASPATGPGNMTNPVASEALHNLIEYQRPWNPRHEG